jgi:hypothetical protein
MRESLCSCFFSFRVAFFADTVDLTVSGVLQFPFLDRRLTSVLALRFGPIDGDAPELPLSALHFFPVALDA